MAQASTFSNENFQEVNVITMRSGQNMFTPSTTTSMPASDAPVLSNNSVKVLFPQALKSTGKVLENQGEILNLLKMSNCLYRM